MTEFDRLAAKCATAMYVKENVTKITYFNCFGDKIDEKVETKSEVYVFDENEKVWRHGLNGDYKE